MTRIRKSRKPSANSRSTSKTDKSTVSISHDKKPKKKTGKISGNRQLEADKKKSNTRHNPQAKDPRIGSKKPIVLTKTEAQPAQSQKQKPPRKPQPIAAVRVLEPTESVDSATSFAQRLAEIEQDEKLLAIIAKQEDDIALDETEIDYYNQLMDEHAELEEALGEASEEDAPSADNSQPMSEEDLWDKLDSNDFSNFDEEQDS